MENVPGTSSGGAIFCAVSTSGTTSATSSRTNRRERIKPSVRLPARERPVDEIDDRGNPGVVGVFELRGMICARQRDHLFVARAQRRKHSSGVELIDAWIVRAK